MHHFATTNSGVLRPPKSVVVVVPAGLDSVRADPFFMSDDTIPTFAVTSGLWFLFSLEPAVFT